MVSPNSAGESDTMFARPLIIWGIAAVVAMAALFASAEPVHDVTSLERGLGPEVQTSRL